jgi:hypothetical protein
MSDIPTTPDTEDYSDMPKKEKLLHVVLSVQRPVTFEFATELAGINVETMDSSELEDLSISIKKYRNEDGKYFAGGEGTSIGHKMITNELSKSLGLDLDSENY